MGFHQAFDFGYPNLGVAAMMSALPLLIPLVILLMRRIRTDRGAVVSIALTRAADGLSPRLRRAPDRCVLGVVLLIWTLLPVYNMLLIALSDDADEFTGDDLARGLELGQLPRRLDRRLLVPRAFLAPVRQQLLSWRRRR